MPIPLVHVHVIFSVANGVLGTTLRLRSKEGSSYSYLIHAGVIEVNVSLFYSLTFLFQSAILGMGGKGRTIKPNSALSR